MTATENVIRILLSAALVLTLTIYTQSPDNHFAKDPWFMPLIFVLVWMTYYDK